MATQDLQNSYGPEMALNGHDAPQAVAGDGLEAMHAGHQHPLAPPYSEQHAKNEYYPQGSEQPHDTGRKKRVAGLPVAAFWGIVVGLVLILAIGLGIGLGVGLSQRDNSSSAETAAAATASATAGADAAITSMTSASATPSASTASASRTTKSSTTSATRAAATARNVEICNQASLAVDCTNLTVPVNTCGMPPDPSLARAASCAF
jgi:hypothetical protein